MKGETYTEAFEADFFHLENIKDDPNWQISAWPQHGHPYAMNYEKQNVIANPVIGSSASDGDPGLQMVVRGPTQRGSAVSTAELKTVREDMHYGSYRVALKYSQEPGTCGAMFWVSRARAFRSITSLRLIRRPSTNNTQFYGGTCNHPMADYRTV